MKINYLVINQNNGGMVLFKDMFKLFAKPEDAMKHAKSIGWDSPMKPDFTLGIKNVYSEGRNVDISIIAIEVVEENKVEGRMG